MDEPIGFPLPQPGSPLLGERTHDWRTAVARRQADAVVFRDTIPVLIALFGEERMASELKMTLQRLRNCLGLQYPPDTYEPPVPALPPYDWRYRLNDLWNQVARIFRDIAHEQGDGHG